MTDTLIVGLSQPTVLHKPFGKSEIQNYNPTSAPKSPDFVVRQQLIMLSDRGMSCHAVQPVHTAVRPKLCVCECVERADPSRQGDDDEGSMVGLQLAGTP